MTEKNIFTVTDLGGGDGGKGGVVHKICMKKNAHTVLKVGGAQGSHGVRTSRGESFNFSHFGCGTFEGVKTHISKLMVIEPYRLMQEAQLLQLEWGIKNIWDYMTIDEDVLCVTPYHTYASKLRELARKDHPKGTVGIGVGEAYYDAEHYPELAIRIADINKPSLREKIEAVRKQKITELVEHFSRTDMYWPEDQYRANECIELLLDQSLIERTAENFKAILKKMKIVDTQYLKNNILSRDGTVVVESSHGILTDRYYGFHPHTTKLRTLPSGTLALLKECDYQGDIHRLGVTRAYQIRHGAGPMVTESPAMLDVLLPGSNKDENRWQGKVRVGPLDLVALRYAIEVCGGSEVFDGLAVTWFDQIKTIGRWDICDRYHGDMDDQYFVSNERIKVRRGEDLQQLEHQEELGVLLKNCKPNIASYDIPRIFRQEEMTSVCQGVLENALNVPLRMISFGPTEKDKVCI